jgi:predicted amidohydrolase
MKRTSHNRSARPSQREKLRLAAVQMRFGETIDDNLASIADWARMAVQRRADAVLFPECATTGYAYEFQTLKPAEIKHALQALSIVAREQRINLLVGTPVFRRGKLYNCLVVFDRKGQITHCYAKNHLTPSDEQFFVGGNSIALFAIDGVPATAIICHERRYPELVRLGVMAGARIVFHPNAGMDSLAVSRKKRNGRDGVVSRAFENAIYYVFSNTVGPQGNDKWSAGDSKIVAPNETVLACANNRDEAIIAATVNLSDATRSYAQRGIERPAFLRSHWKKMVREVRRQAAETTREFDLP